MCVIDLDPCDVWEETKVKARKEHECDCCGGTIKPGKIYVRHFSIYDKRIAAEKMCEPCDRIAAEFQEEHGQRTQPGAMPDLLNDCVADGDESSTKWQLHLLNMQRRGKRRAARLTP